MAEIKLTKTELRDQQNRLVELQKYLPVLQLKKALLQLEVGKALEEIEQIEQHYSSVEEIVRGFTSLFNQTHAFDLFKNIEVKKVHTTLENVAGVEVAVFQSVDFNESSYSLYVLPSWVDTAIAVVRDLLIIRERLQIAKNRCEAFRAELTEVSIRVNLFEKILIPRTVANIKKIKIFLGDQQLAAVAQAKVAKKKILFRKMKEASA